jgi:lipopolysaccharide biosynthesis glycosyltransferase
MKKVSITSSCNDNYVNYLLALLASIVDNTPNTQIEFNLIYESLSEKSINLITSKFNEKVSLNFVKIDKSLLDNVILEAFYKVSYEAYTRILIPTLLKKLDKTIYLDPDIIVLKDLNILFNTDIGNYEIGAVVDFNPNSINLFQNAFDLKGVKSYFNSGVMLMNLKKLRESEFTKRGLDLIKKSNKTYKFFDQDILNYFYSNNFFRLDPRWNTQLYIELNSSNYIHTTLTKEEFENCIKEPYLVHYTIVKPDKLNYFFKFRNIYKKYLKLAGLKFVTKRTSILEIFWTLVELAFFRTINLLKPQIRNKILNFTRFRVIKFTNSIKK